MGSKADKFPPLMVASGGQALLKRRFVSSVVKTQRAAGWAVIEVDGADPGALQDVLVEDLFDPVQTLALVGHPEKASLEVLEAHAAAKTYLTTLFLVLEGEPDGRTKFGKAVSKTWASVHKAFPLPTDWEASKIAIAFVRSEMQRLGASISEPLATVLVNQSGTDLGVLAFEVDKIAILAKVAGVTEVEPRQIRLGMAPIAEASVFPIVDALAAKQGKKLSQALAAVRRTSKEDPTMHVSRVIASSVIKWLQATGLDAMPPRAAAAELGLNPWHFENKILPAAKCWGKQGTMGLMQDLAAAERAVLNGAISPWMVLASRLLSAIR